MKKQLNLMSITKVVFLLLISSSQVSAHGRYILPSHTVLSGDDPQTVTLISSISNDFFHPDRPLGNDGEGKVSPMLDRLFKILKSELITPAGENEDTVKWQAFSRLSAADVVIEKDGTYRISLIQPETHMTTFKKADGNKGRVFGKETPLPEGASEIKRRIVTSRVETFITKNQPSSNALKPTGKGLELTAVESHPNDLFINEGNKFQLMFNGKPLNKSTKISFIRGGTRHRNSRDEIEVETNTAGEFEVTFKQAGFYLMEADFMVEGEKDSGIDSYHYGLYLTLEVFPE